MLKIGQLNELNFSAKIEGVIILEHTFLEIKQLIVENNTLHLK